MISFLHLCLFLWIVLVLRKLRMSYISPGYELGVADRVSSTRRNQSTERWLAGVEDRKGPVSERLRAEWQTAGASKPRSSVK